MSSKFIKNQHQEESIQVYCNRLAKKNNSVLYMLEEYLSKKMLEDKKLAEIRDVILTVSAEITKIPSRFGCGDDNE